MLFSNLPQAAGYIRKHHYLFAGRFASETLSVLGDMNAQIMKSAMTGATFVAWQFIPETFEHLKTHITVEKTGKGWSVTERIA